MQKRTMYKKLRDSYLVLLHLKIESSCPGLFSFIRQVKRILHFLRITLRSVFVWDIGVVQLYFKFALGKESNVKWQNMLRANYCLYFDNEFNCSDIII